MIGQLLRCRLLPLLWLSLAFTAALVIHYHHASTESTPRVRYRAAAIEINPTSFAEWDGTPSGAYRLMLRNVDLVDEWAGRAASQGAQIVVFPEDLVSSFGGGGPHWRSKFVTPALFAEPLPEPPQQMCGAGGVEGAAPVATALSCVAKKHGVVIVVGLGISAPCERKLEPFTGRPLPCVEETGIGQFDGAAAFGPGGEVRAYISRTAALSSARARAAVRLGAWARDAC